MLNTIKKYINLSITLSILFGLCGIILIVWPKDSLNTIGYILGFFILIYGISNFIESFHIHPLFCLLQMTSGILSTIFGIVMLLNPNIMESMLPILLGIFFIISGSFKAKISYIIKDSRDFILQFICSLSMIICGIIFIINPMDVAITLTITFGIVILVYSLSDTINMCIFKSNINEIDKYFSKLIK